MMIREPVTVPLKAGVFALVNRKRRFVYVSYTQNLQKRSHSMSHMLTQHDEDADAYWPIRALPKHPSDEFVFVVEKEDGGLADDTAAMAAVATVQRRYIAKGYRVIGGQRASSPIVTIKGKKMPLTDAVREYSDVKYLTAYRRIERGWTVEQALGLEPPAPRWHQQKQAERKQRESQRAERVA